MDTKQPRMTVEQFEALWPSDSPFMQIYPFAVEDIGYGTARVRLPFSAHHVRPGDTISGPTVMALADYTIWAVVLGMTGTDYLGSATSSLNANFLRRAALVDLIAEARIIRLGRQLAVGEATVYSDGTDDPVAHVTATYAVTKRI